MLAFLSCLPGFLLKLLYALPEVMEFLAHRGEVRDIITDHIKAGIHVLGIVVHGFGQLGDRRGDVLQTFVHALAKALLHIRKAALGHGGKIINGKFLCHMVLV